MFLIDHKRAFIMDVYTPVSDISIEQPIKTLHSLSF